MGIFTAGKQMLQSLPRTARRFANGFVVMAITFFYDASDGLIEPPEEAFEDWDSEADDVIEQTLWQMSDDFAQYDRTEVFVKLEEVKNLLGPGHRDFLGATPK